MKPVRSAKNRFLDRLAAATARRLANGKGPQPSGAANGAGASGMRSLRKRVDELEREVQESRRLNQRLCDVVDVVTEVLVPAADRDDQRMRAALERLDQTLQNPPRLADPEDDE